MSSLEQAPTRVGERSASPGLVGAQVARTEASDDQWPVGSFGPVAVGANLVADRWTLLVVREMLEGATRFNEIHRGLPCLSRSLLTSRLRHLERLGLVARVPVVGGSRADYLLTPSGRANGHSPDRVDALVWALTELLLDGQGPRIRQV